MDAVRPPDPEIGKHRADKRRRNPPRQIRNKFTKIPFTPRNYAVEWSGIGVACGDKDADTAHFVTAPIIPAAGCSAALPLRQDALQERTDQMKKWIRKTLSLIAAAGIAVTMLGAYAGTAEAASASAASGTAAAASVSSGSSLSSASMAAAATSVFSVEATSAVISGSNVVVSVSTNVTPSSDDGLYHLYASDVYQSDSEGTEVGSCSAGAAGSTAQFTFALNLNTASSRLSQKFTVVCIQGGSKVAVSNPIYIQNPESVATHTTARRDYGKKGLLPESTLLHSTTLSETGVQQVTYNVLVGNILSGSGITYTYNGKTFTFSSATIGELDDLVPRMNNQGIQVTLILLNNWSGSYTTNIHPLSRDSYSQNYYAFNTAEQAGVEELQALAAFLGERYSGGVYGTVDNWIVGNEINARSPWHYMTASAGFDYFSAEYAKAFRIFYNGLKSQNANVNVYTCVDQEYAASDNASLHYAGQTFLIYFNQLISATGNIDWGVAVHPYDYPLYDPYVWLQTVNYPDKVNHTQTSAYVTMANIEVFTDFMCTEDMLSPSGAVRSIICSEQGYVSSSGETVQAAAIVYAYLQAMNNQYIDAFILAREMDHTDEIAQGLRLGIRNTGGSAKTGVNWYLNAETSEVQAAASAVIGANIADLLTIR